MKGSCEAAIVLILLTFVSTVASASPFTPLEWQQASSATLQPRICGPTQAHDLDQRSKSQLH